MSALSFKINADWQKITQLRAEIDRLKQSLSTMDVNKNTTQVKQLQDRLSLAQAEMKGLVSDVTRTANEFETHFKNSIYAASKTVNDLSSEIIKQKEIIRSTKNDVQALADKYKTLGKWGPESASTLTALNSTKKALGEQTYALGELQSAQSRARLNVSGLRNEYSLLKRDTLSGLGSFTSQFTNIASLSVLGIGLGEIISKIIEVRGQFEQMEASIGVFLNGDKAKAHSLMGEVKQYALISPLTTKDMMGSMQTMLGFGISGDDSVKYLKELGDVSQGNTEHFNSLSLAFSKTVSEGKLMGKEFNSMVYAGFNPLQIISQKTGKSMGELRSEMRKGAITANMVKDAFLTATSAGGKFYNMANTQVNTVKGQVSMLEEALDLKLNDIGEANEGVIMSGVKMATSMVNNFDTIGKSIEGLLAVYGLYKTAVMLSIAIEKVQIGMKMAEEFIQISKALGTATAAQALFNGAALLNPYAMLGAAAIGLVGIMYKLSDSQYIAKQGIEAFNAKIAESKAHYDNLNSVISKYLPIAQNANLKVDQRTQAINILKSVMPSYFKDLDTEAAKYYSIANASNAANQANHIRIRMMAIEDKRAMDEAAAKVNKLNADLSGGYFAPTPGVASGNAAILLAERELKLKTAEYKASQKAINDLNKSMVKKTAANVTLKSNNAPASQQTKNEFKDIADLNKEIKQLRGGKLWHSGALADEIKQREDAIKKHYSNIKEYTGVDYTPKAEDKRAKQALSAEQKANTNMINTAEKEYQLAKEKQKQQRDAEDSKLDLWQSDIDAMQEGYAKEKAQLDLNVAKLILENKTKKEEMIQKMQDDDKSLWEKRHPNYAKNGQFYTSSLTESDLSKPQKEILSNDNKKVADLKIKGNYDINKKMLDQYQDYETQKLEIAKKYDDAIDSLKKRRSDLPENDPEYDKFTRAIAQATKEKGEKLMSAAFEQFKKNPDYSRAFDDLKNTSTETLQNLIVQLQQFRSTSQQSFDPKDIKEWNDAIKKITDEIDERDPFTAIKEKMENYVLAKERLKQAEKELTNSNIYVQGENPIVAPKASLNKNGKTETTYDVTTTKVDKASVSLENYKKAKDGVATSDNELNEAELKATEKIGELASAIKGVGISIGGTSGEIISFMGDVGSFAASTGENILKVSAMTAGALKTIETASVVLAVISAAIQLMQKLNTLLDGQNGYNKYKEKIDEINKLTEAVYEYHTAALKAQQTESDWFGGDNLGKLNDYSSLMSSTLKEYNEILNEQQAIYKNKSGSGWLTSTSGLLSGQWFSDTLLGTNLMGNNYTEGTTSAINNLRIETRKKSSGFLGSGVGGHSQQTEDLRTWAKANFGVDLFDSNNMINTTIANEIINQYGDKLAGNTKETLTELVTLRTQYDEYLTELKQYVSQLYEPILTDFTDSMWSWLQNGEDALYAFKDTAKSVFKSIVNDMMQRIILTDFAQKYMDQIQAAYTKYAATNGTASDISALDNTISTVLGNLTTDWGKAAPEMEKIFSSLVSSIENATGVDLTTTAQSSTSGGVTTMTSDQASELNGRLANSQESINVIRDNTADNAIELRTMVATQSAMLLIQTNQLTVAGECRDLVKNSYSELSGIHEDTTNMLKLFKDSGIIYTMIKKIQDNTSKL